MQRTFNAKPLGAQNEQEAFELVLDSGVSGSIDSLGLLATLRRVKESYERWMGAVESPVRVLLSAEKCEAVGYNFASGEIRFCDPLSCLSTTTVEEPISVTTNASLTSFVVL